MLFNSYEFILLYLPITLILYYQLAKRISNSAAKNFLIFASLCFYSYWDVRNLPILLTSISVNYLFGHLLSKNRNKVILTAGINLDVFVLSDYSKNLYDIDDFYDGNYHMNDRGAEKRTLQMIKELKALM